MKEKTRKALLKIAAAAALLAVPAAVSFTHSGTDLPAAVSVAIAGCVASMWCISRIHKIREKEGWEANREQIHPLESEGRK